MADDTAAGFAKLRAFVDDVASAEKTVSGRRISIKDAILVKLAIAEMRPTFAQIEQLVAPVALENPGHAELLWAAITQFTFQAYVAGGSMAFSSAAAELHLEPIKNGASAGGRASGEKLKDLRDKFWNHQPLLCARKVRKDNPFASKRRVADEIIIALKLNEDPRTVFNRVTVWEKLGEIPKRIPKAKKGRKL